MKWVDWICLFPLMFIFIYGVGMHEWFPIVCAVVGIAAIAWRVLLTTNKASGGVPCE